jgi:acyl carrier protein
VQLGAYHSSLETPASDVPTEEASDGRLEPAGVVTAADGAASTPQTSSSMEAEIRGFLAEIFFLGDDPASLPSDKSLITAGIIDSTGVLELVGFLEEQYAIRIEDEELLPENLDTVENIVRFVSRKRGSA